MRCFNDNLLRKVLCSLCLLVCLAVILPSCKLPELFAKRQKERLEPLAEELYHDDKDMTIEAIDLDVEIEPEGELVQIQDQDIEVVVPPEWEYLGSGDLKNRQLVRTGIVDYYPDNGPAIGLPAGAFFFWRYASVRFTDVTRRETDPRENIRIVVNGREWTGYHGINGPYYTAALETPEGDRIIRMVVSRGRSKTFSITEDSVLMMLATVHYTGE